MKRPFVVAAALLLAAGCGRHGGAPAAPPMQNGGAQVSQGLSAALTTTPAPPHTGDDTLILSLSDVSTHAPVGDANVSATAQMLSPRLPGSPVTGRAQGNGIYQIPIRLGIATRYLVQVQVQRTGKPVSTFTFPLEAQQ